MKPFGSRKGRWFGGMKLWGEGGGGGGGGFDLEGRCPLASKGIWVSL